MSTSTQVAPITRGVSLLVAAGAVACAGAPADPADPATNARPAAVSPAAVSPAPEQPALESPAQPADLPEPPQDRRPSDPADSGPAGPLGYELVRSYPHDPTAFTQGLVFHAGRLYEGTGRRGASSLREVDLETGAVVRQVDLPADLFGEGIAVVDDRVVQLTWTSRIGFVYDLETFELRSRFQQVSEGWGLTYDGRSLIQSDGSSRLYFLDPESLALTRELVVRDDGVPVDSINELEYVDGEIWANVWFETYLLRIAPSDGRVLGRIELEDLVDPSTRNVADAVLNGIAYDADRGRVFVTGKLWSRLHEIRIVER